MFTEDIAGFFADGEELQVQGITVMGYFNRASQLVLGDVLITAPSVELPASVAAAEGGTCIVRGDTYRIRQVLDQPPDGAIRTLVLAKG